MNLKGETHVHVAPKSVQCSGTRTARLTRINTSMSQSVTDLSLSMDNAPFDFMAQGIHPLPTPLLTEFMNKGWEFSMFITDYM